MDGSAVEFRTTARPVYLIQPIYDGLRAIPGAVAWAASPRATSPRRLPNRDAHPGTSRAVHYVAVKSIITASPAAPASRVAHFGLPESRVPVATSRAADPFRPSRAELFAVVRQRSLHHAPTVWDDRVASSRHGHSGRVGAVQLFVSASNIHGGGPRAGIAPDGGDRGQERTASTLATASIEPNAPAPVTGPVPSVPPEPSDVSREYYPTRQQPARSQRADDIVEPSASTQLASAADGPSSPAAAATTTAAAVTRNRARWGRRSSIVRERKTISPDFKKAGRSTKVGRSAAPHVQGPKTIFA